MVESETKSLDADRVQFEEWDDEDKELRDELHLWSGGDLVTIPLELGKGEKVRDKLREQGFIDE